MLLISSDNIVVAQMVVVELDVNLTNTQWCLKYEQGNLMANNME